MGKHGHSGDKGHGWLVVVSEQGRAGWWAVAVLLVLWWAWRAAWWCVMSASVRSMTAHIAHTQRVHGIGHEYHEYSEGVELAGSTE